MTAKQKIQDVILKKPKNNPGKDFFDQKKKSEKTKESKPKGKIIFGALLLLIAVIAGAKVLNAFSKAVIKVKLHNETINIDTVLRSGTDIFFETMELQITKEKSMNATGVKQVSQKASGQIMVYNAYNSQPQTLIANTRFEAADGKIYRTNKQIVVPGAQVTSEELVPGSIEVTVYADAAGEKYNMGLTDFRIPGFKNSPRYEKFYARSKTPMSGGFEGEMPVISDDDEQTLRESLEAEIKTELTQKTELQKPENYVLYDKATEITFIKNQTSENSEMNSQNPSFVLNETGSLFAYILPEKELSKILVKKYYGEEMVEKIEVSNLKDLNFEIISSNKENGTIVFKLNGNAKFVWVIDEEKLKEALIASPENLNKVFESYSAIEQALVGFSPSWWRIFPEKTEKIEIEPVVN